MLVAFIPLFMARWILDMAWRTSKRAHDRLDTFLDRWECP